MKPDSNAPHYWQVLVNSYPQRVRFRLDELLSSLRLAFPYQEGELDARKRLLAILQELDNRGMLRLPKASNRRAYDHSERVPLPRFVTRIDQPRALPDQKRMWRPELAFANNVAEAWHDTLTLIQKWLRNGGTTAPPIALRERSVEIFGDEKYLDGLLGTQLFSPGRLTLDLLRCYLPSVPICVASIPADGQERPLLVLENVTTFDTLRRWNEQHRRYFAVAFGGGTAFVSSCRSLSPYLCRPGCSGTVFYFGDVDPKGLWIPLRAATESGITVRADESLYLILFQAAKRKVVVRREPLSYQPGLLDWLPAALRRPTAEYFESGRRLPQELISIHDLRPLVQAM
jgi:hypothetical protein